MENSKRSYPLHLASQLVCFVLIILIIFFTQGILVPLLFAMLIAITLYPVCVRLEKWRFPRVLASITCVIIAIIVVAAIFYLIISQVINIGKDGQDIVVKFQSIFDTIQNWISIKFGVEQGDIANKLRETGNNALNNAAGYLSSAFSSVGGTLANVILMPIFIFFMLYYRDFFREFFFHAFKSKDQQVVHEVLNKIYYVVKSYLLGLITVMGIVAILNSVGLMVLGIQHAWFFGILASLLMLLPYIGIAIGSILPALFALATKENYWYSIGVIAWFQVVQFLEGNIITPNIVGSKVSINPLMAMLSLLFGGMLFGISGLILALPITAIIKVILDSIPTLSHFGFLIGEPEKYHLKRQSSIIMMKRWKLKSLLDKKAKTPPASKK